MPKVEVEREEDGRWITKISALRGVMTRGAIRDEAVARAELLASRVLADRVEHAEAVPHIAVRASRRPPRAGSSGRTGSG